MEKVSVINSANRNKKIKRYKGLLKINTIAFLSYAAVLSAEVVLPAFELRDKPSTWALLFLALSIVLLGILRIEHILGLKSCNSLKDKGDLKGRLFTKKSLE